MRGGVTIECMSALALETVAWAAGLAVTLVALIASTAAVAWIATMLLAGVWCWRLDAEDDAIQLVGPDALNRYPTHGSVNR